MAIKYLAGNKLTGTQAERVALASGVTDYLIDGTLFYEIGVHGNGANDGNDIWKWDKLADGWEVITGSTETESLSGKTFIDYLLVAERSAPGSSVGSGKGAFYVDSSGVFYGKFENETPVNLGESAGATTFSGLSDTTISGLPSSGTTGHILVYDNSNSWDNKLLAGIAAGGAGECVISITNAGLVGINSITGLANSGTVLDLVSAGNVSIFPTMGTNTLSVGASGSTVNILGNLIVSGVTTTVNTETLTVEDPLILLSSGASSGAVDAGFVVERGSDTNMAFVWDETEDAFGAFSTSSDASGAGGNMNVTTYQPLQIGGLTATTGAFSSNLTTNRKLLIDTDAFNITLGADGHLFHIDAQTMTDNTTSASGTASANFALFTIDQPTLSATNASVTTTNAYTMYIANAPVSGGSNSAAITNAYALYVAGGASHFVGAVSGASSITGATLVSTAATTANSLVVTTSATVGTTLGVTGTTTTASSTGHVSVGGNLTVSGTSGFTGVVTLPSSTALTTPAIAGGTAIELTKLSVRDNSAAYDLEFQSATTGMNNDRILIFNVNNVDRTVALAGNVTFAGAVTTAGAFITSGAYSLTLTTTATTNVTLPSTGTLATLLGAEVLAAKTLTTPQIVDGGSINCGTHNSGVNQLIIFDSVVSAVNEFTILNAATGNGSSTGTPTLSVTGDDTNIALTLKGKGTGASAVIAGGATGACIEFNTKYTGGNPPLGNESARMYLKEVDSQNNAIAVRIFKANAYQEVEITSPKAICGECGSKDGAKDPTYDFSRSMMLVDLWCGHSYEVPMTGWNKVS